MYFQVIIRTELSYLIEKQRYVILINRFIFADLRMRQRLQIQRLHDIQSCTATRYFYRFPVAFAYPAVANFVTRIG